MSFVRVSRLLVMVISLVWAIGCSDAADGKKKIVFLTGPPSHGFGAHAHGAQSALFAKLLRENVPGVQTEVVREWKGDPAPLEGAAAIVISCDGGSLIVKHLDVLDNAMKKGVGMACIHYAVDVPKGKAGDRMLGWIGGYYEQWWSVNPTWEAEFKSFPDHPITRGVKPFKINDEWYYHMRFRENMQGVTPILSAVPPESTRERGDGPHSGNPTVCARKGMAEIVAWAAERPGGGRGFGTTAGHFYWNWGHNQMRKLMLNAFVWIAGLDVPPDGVQTKPVTAAEMGDLIEKKPANGWNPIGIQRMLDGWNKKE